MHLMWHFACDGCCHQSLAVPSAHFLVSSGPSSVLAALMHKTLVAGAWLAVVVVAVGIDADVAWQWWTRLVALLMMLRTQRGLSAVGQRCSTPTMLLSTCCIDTRVGDTIPGLGGHFGH